MKTRIKIAELARDLDMTLSDLECETGINYSALIRYNRGDTQFLRLDWLRTLQKVLKCISVDSMLEDVPDDWKYATARINRSAIKRFWNKVDKTDTCWLWKGYGQYFYARKDRPIRPRRYVFIALGKPLQSTKEVFGNCENENCVNPAHLLIVGKEHHAQLARSSGVRKSKYTNEFLQRIYDLTNDVCVYEGCEIELNKIRVRRYALCPYHSCLVRTSMRGRAARYERKLMEVSA